MHFGSLPYIAIIIPFKSVNIKENPQKCKIKLINISISTKKQAERLLAAQCGKCTMTKCDQSKNLFICVCIVAAVIVLDGLKPAEGTETRPLQGSLENAV